MSRTSLLSITLFIGMLSFAAAKDDDSKNLRMRLFAVALHPEQGKVRMMAGKQPGPAFELPVFSFTGSMPVEARKFRLITDAANPDPKAPSLCDVVLPEQGEDFRIILVPLREGGYKSFVVRGDDPKFAAGDVFFVNLSSHHVIGLLGTAKLDLELGEREIVRLEGAKAGIFFEVKIASREGNGITPLADTRWPVLRNNRSIVVFHDDLNGQPVYRAVDEFLKPK